MKAKQKERNKVRAQRESDFNRDGLWDRAVIQLKSVELHRTRRACRENSVRATINDEIKIEIKIITLRFFWYLMNENRKNPDLIWK